MKTIAAWILGAMLFPIAAAGQEAQPAPPAKAAPKKAAEPKAKPPQSAGSGQVTVFVPKYDYSYYVATPYPEYKIESMREERRGGGFDVMIDRQPVGHVAPGKPLTVALPAGPHRLHFDDGGILGVRITQREETPITVFPGKTSYFYAPRNPLSGIQPAELDPVTAKALIDGVDPKASGTATIYIYWEGMPLEIGFLKSDFEFFVDDQSIGTMTSGEYITAKVPAGRRLLTRRATGFLAAGPPRLHGLILSAGTTHYYLLRKEITGAGMVKRVGPIVTAVDEFYQLTAEQVGPELKSLRQR
jgi:hypothetical protein